MDKYRRNWKEYVERIPINQEDKVWEDLCGVMEKLCFVICITGLDRQTIRMGNNDVKFPNEGSVNVRTTLVTGDTSC
jgi:hypothetical protein